MRSNPLTIHLCPGSKTARVTAFRFLLVAQPGRGLLVHTGALRGAESARAQPRSTQPNDLCESPRRHRVSIVRAEERAVQREEADPVGGLDADPPRVLSRQSHGGRHRRRIDEEGSRGARESNVRVGKRVHSRTNPRRWISRRIQIDPRVVELF